MSELEKAVLVFMLTSTAWFLFLCWWDPLGKFKK